MNERSRSAQGRLADRRPVAPTDSPTSTGRLRREATGRQTRPETTRRLAPGRSRAWRGPRRQTASCPEVERARPARPVCSANGHWTRQNASAWRMTDRGRRAPHPFERRSVDGRRETTRVFGTRPSLCPFPRSIWGTPRTRSGRPRRPNAPRDPGRDEERRFSLETSANILEDVLLRRRPGAAVPSLVNHHSGTTRGGRRDAHLVILR